MIIELLAVALILGIAFFQVTQGIFSSLIMAIITVACSAMALGTYEMLADTMYGSQPAHADAAALIVLFALPLLALRLIFDRLIKGNVVMGMWADRIGGGLLGIISGVFIAGMLLIIIQMLPFGPSVMGYKPFSSTFERNQRAYADEFVVGMVNLFSKYSLSTGKPFEDTHDDFFLELYCARNQMEQKYRDDSGEDKVKYVGRVDTPPDAIRVMGIYQPGNEAALQDAPENPQIEAQNASLSSVIIVRVAVSQDARDAEDNWWRLPATHFRLVTTGKDGKTRSYYPVGYLTCWNAPLPYASYQNNYKDYENQLVASPWELVIPARDEKTGKPEFGKLAVCRRWYVEGGPTELVVDWVYRIPTDVKPTELFFRRVAKAAMPAQMTEGMPETTGKGGVKLGLAKRIKQQ